MIILTADENKIYASYTDENFVSGSNIYLPDSADVTQWQQFDNVESAKEYYGIVEDDEMKNAEMLEALGVQPNNNISIKSLL